MKTLLGLLLVVAIGVGVSPYARSLGAPSPPPNISAADWIPLNDSAGFVITHNPLHAGPAPRNDIVRGYFVIHRGNAWLRVDSGLEPDVRNASLAR